LAWEGAQCVRGVGRTLGRLEHSTHAGAFALIVPCRVSWDARGQDRGDAVDGESNAKIWAYLGCYVCYGAPKIGRSVGRHFWSRR
jgi:hypothetical protein